MLGSQLTQQSNLAAINKRQSSIKTMFTRTI